jgi:hypothetical protein
MAIVMTVDGATVDYKASRLRLDRLIPYRKDGGAELAFSVRGGPMPAVPDGYLGKEVTLTIDSTLYFKGDCGPGATSFVKGLGWVTQYRAEGLHVRANRLPVLAGDGTDTLRFNLPKNDVDYNPQRAGRTIGQMALATLAQAATASALHAQGIGNRTSAGAGGVGAAVLAADAVNSISVTLGGSGYTTAPNVILMGGGGSGATATATVTAGAITSFTVTDGGEGYTSPPEVIITTLPTTTVTELLALDVQPVREVTIQGERLLAALDGLIRAHHPNHWIHIEAGGTIRCYDLRSTTPVTLEFESETDLVDTASLSYSRDVSDCFTRVVYRGSPKIEPVELRLNPPIATDGYAAISEAFGHSGLDNEEAKAQYVYQDFSTPGQALGTAKATAVLDGTTVDTITVDSGGYGYTSAPAVAIVGGGGSGATATATLTGDTVTSISVTAPGSSYETTPLVRIGGPGVGQYSIGNCTCPSTTTVEAEPSDSTAKWATNYWDQTASGAKGKITLSQSLGSGLEQVISRRIVSCDALTAGGTATLTLDEALPNTDYDSYYLVGEATGGAVTWTRYEIENKEIAAAIVNQFPYDVIWRTLGQLAAARTSYPVANVLWSSTGEEPYEERPIGITAIDTDLGYIYFDIPTPKVYAPDSEMQKGGAAVAAFAPIDIRVMVPVAKDDAREAIVPSSGYEGTAYDDEGLERTLYVFEPSWRDGTDAERMELAAQEILDSVKDTVIEGSVSVLKQLDSVLVPGKSLNLDGPDWSSPLASMGTPIIAAELVFDTDSIPLRTVMTFSNRRAAFSGAVLTSPPPEPFGVF